LAGPVRPDSFHVDSGGKGSEMTFSETTIYKITTRALWAQGTAEASLPPSPLDLEDGFMHFSTASQLGETLRLYFAGRDDLVLCAVPLAGVAADLRWETSRDGALFPHLYGSLPMTAIAAHFQIAVAEDGACALPEGIA
jgi:uncharacterized protein (DUF952 family)